MTGLAVGLLLIIYFLLDTWLYKKELKDNEELKKPVAYVPFGFEGSINFVLLACIVGAVLMSGFWKTGVEYHFLVCTLRLNPLFATVFLRQLQFFPSFLRRKSTATPTSSPGNRFWKSANCSSAFS